MMPENDAKNVDIEGVEAQGEAIASNEKVERPSTMLRSSPKERSITGPLSLLVAIAACISAVFIPEIRELLGVEVSSTTPLTVEVSSTTPLTLEPSDLAGQIAFVTGRNGNYEIYVAQVDGTDERRITYNNADDDDPAWSPDGRFIAFNSNRDGNYEIYIIGIDGSFTRRLTNNTANDFYPAWSPDGRFIAFHSLVDGNAEIYLVEVESMNLFRLTDNPASDWDAAWSPDGSQIAFVSDRDDPNAGECESLCNNEIYVMDYDGMNQRRLTDNAFNDKGPVWSPDGRLIAYISGQNPRGIYVMNVDGTGQHFLVQCNLRGGITWSPDGDYIAFESLVSGGWGIHIIKVDGLYTHELILGDSWGPTWSP